MDENEYKYWLIAYIGCCLMLATCIYMNIKHQQRMFDILEKYEQDIEKIHENSNEGRNFKYSR